MLSANAWVQAPPLPVASFEKGGVLVIQWLCGSVVGVAEWLRRQVVALEVEGSNPSAHPTRV